MKGFVPTPPATVDLMVAKLFDGVPATPDLRVLDPGCGEGEFIHGIVRYCQAHQRPLPHITGVELDPGRAAIAKRRFASVPLVEIRQADFLRPSTDRFDLIVGNPPYVSILGLDVAERASYRSAYSTARGRFDLYVLFFEQALRLLAPGGRLVFITPEKFLYVESTRPLRAQLATRRVEELHFASESTFGELVTYPLISTISAERRGASTRIVRRDGTSIVARLDTADSWLPLVNGYRAAAGGLTLGDVALRVSCGVATGADQVYVMHESELTDELRPFAHPTISGRQISNGLTVVSDSVILAPYDAAGGLLPERALGALACYLQAPGRRALLAARTCAARKQWYSFHDNLPLGAMLRPKLLCKDITESPFFVVDERGTIVPRHSVYYVVPADPSDLAPLAIYLNSAQATEWLRAHCQRAAKGFLRMQSHVLKRLPLPSSFEPRLGALARCSGELQAVPA